MKKIHPVIIARNFAEMLCRRHATLNECKSYRTKLYNFPDLCQQDLWLPQFIEERLKHLTKEKKARLAVFSVFGPKWRIDFERANVKIFLSRENLHRPGWSMYAAQGIDNPKIDLTIGFDYISDVEKYIRVPLWVMWVFSPYDSYHTIKEKILQWNNPENHSYTNRKFCAYLCSHADYGRKMIYDEMSAIGKVDCDGKLFHNNDDLKEKYADDKLAYLRQYRFNLCPENSNYAGYCTEKLFEAIHAGCIPVYHGSDNQPEPNVLNKNAICFIEMGKDNSDAMRTIEFLNSNEKAYLEFARQPRFVEGAADIIWGYYEMLELRIKELVKGL